MIRGQLQDQVGGRLAHQLHLRRQQPLDERAAPALRAAQLVFVQFGRRFQLIEQRQCFQLIEQRGFVQFERRKYFQQLQLIEFEQFAIRALAALLV